MCSEINRVPLSKLLPEQDPVSRRLSQGPRPTQAATAKSAPWSLERRVPGHGAPVTAFAHWLNAKAQGFLFHNYKRRTSSIKRWKVTKRKGITQSLILRARSVNSEAFVSSLFFQHIFRF